MTTLDKARRFASAVLSQLYTPQKTLDGDGRTTWYHTGSALVIYPEAGLVVALSGNWHGHWAKDAVGARP